MLYFPLEHANEQEVSSVFVNSGDLCGQHILDAVGLMVVCKALTPMTIACTFHNVLPIHGMISAERTGILMVRSEGFKTNPQR